MINSKTKSIAAVTILATALSACAVGPDYHRPNAPQTMPSAFVGAREDVRQEPAATRWWKLYNDAILDGYVEESLAANTDLRVAVANVERSRAYLRVTKDELLPSTDIEIGGKKIRNVDRSEADMGRRMSTVQGGLEVSYEVDLFGRLRRRVEAARGDWQAVEADRDAVMVAVIGDTVEAYSSVLAGNRSVDAARHTVELLNRSLSITEARARIGRADQLDVLRIRTLRDQADRIVIATGSRPSIPGGWQEALGDRLIVNDDVFDWEDLPESVAVVGAGVIGLELAQALHRLGVRVRIYDRDETIGPLTDPEVEREATRIFLGEIPASLGVVATPSLAADGRVSVMTEDASGNRTVEAFDYLLVAAGRRPNLDRLGLASAGIEQDEAGLPTIYRATMQSNRSHIFIAGDANGFRPLLHEAADDGAIAGDNAGRYPIVRARPRRASLGIVFSDPQIAMAGATHRDLVGTGVAFEVAEANFAKQGRSRVMLQNRGMIRTYADVATGIFLGAEMVGPAADHIGHLLAWSAQRGDTVQQMLDSPFYHPVVEEGVRTALRELQRKLSIAPPTPESCLDCIAGS